MSAFRLSFSFSTIIIGHSFNQSLCPLCSVVPFVEIDTKLYIRIFDSSHSDSCYRNALFTKQAGVMCSYYAIGCLLKVFRLNNDDRALCVGAEWVVESECVCVCVFWNRCNKCVVGKLTDYDNGRMEERDSDGHFSGYFVDLGRVKWSEVRKRLVNWCLSYFRYDLVALNEDCSGFIDRLLHQGRRYKVQLYRI